MGFQIYWMLRNNIRMENDKMFSERKLIANCFRKIENYSARHLSEEGFKPLLIYIKYVARNDVCQ